MLTSIEFILFSIFSATQKCTKKSKLTKELSENTCEEVQVTGNIVGHGRRKRFHNGVNAEYSLKKLVVAVKAVAELGVNLDEGIIIVIVMVVAIGLVLLLARHVHH